MMKLDQDAAGYRIKMFMKAGTSFVMCLMKIYAIVLKETNQIIGCISLMFKDKANLSILEDEAELGYWIGRPYWNQGYVSEAAKTLIRCIYQKFGV